MQNEEVLKYVYNLCQKEDGYTAAHSSRVAKIAHTIGSALGLSECDMDALNEASKLHDIGKIHVSLQVLNKPGKLTDEEFEEMKKHSAYGFAIVSPEDAEIADIILSHHERYDGSGYPNGLSGEDIPYLARIIAVADSIDAMHQTDVTAKPCHGQYVWMKSLKTEEKCMTRMWSVHLIHANMK